MARGPRTWKCQKQSGGVKCHHVNPKVKHICEACGKRRPPSKPPAHRQVMELPLWVFVLVNEGVEACAICGATKNLQRDHEHRGDGLVRGVLCWRHNKLLSDNDWTPEMLRRAADYLERAERWRGVDLRAFVE